MNKLKYIIEVYEDHALIRGRLSTRVLKALLKLCKEEKFKNLVASEEGGFKLVREDEYTG